MKENSALCVFSMDICHLKNSELEPQFQKYKGRVVLRVDIVKHDSVSYAVFTEQGSSASQMTAAKVMDIISRLPGCAGQAAGAVSAYTQLKMEDAHKLLIPKSECPGIWIRSTKKQIAKSWSSMEDPVVPLERNLYGRHLAGLFLMGKAIRESSIGTRLGESSKFGMLIRTPRKKTILVCVCHDIKVAGKNKNIDPMWKLLNKEVDLGKPTSFLW